MGLITTIQCDCGCRKKIEIADVGFTRGSEQIVQIVDALGNKKYFLTTECFLKWAATYDCPYSPEDFRDPDEDEAPKKVKLN